MVAGYASWCWFFSDESALGWRCWTTEWLGVQLETLISLYNLGFNVHVFFWGEGRH